MKERYFHGGNRGLQARDYLLPRAETGAPGMPNNPLCRSDRVYLTRSIESAQFFASAAAKPVVYEAVPEGDIEDDPDYPEPGISIACRKARIIALHKVPGKIIKKHRKRMLAKGARAEKVVNH